MKSSQNSQQKAIQSQCLTALDNDGYAMTFHLLSPHLAYWEPWYAQVSSKRYLCWVQIEVRHFRQWRLNKIENHRGWFRPDHPPGKNLEVKFVPVFFPDPFNDRTETITPSTIGVITVIDHGFHHKYPIWVISINANLKPQTFKSWSNAPAANFRPPRFPLQPGHHWEVQEQFAYIQ